MFLKKLENQVSITGFQSCMPYKMPPAHPKKYKFSGYGGDWATANLALPHCYRTCKDGTVRKVTKSNKPKSICYP